MKAIGAYIIIDEIPEPMKKTQGGLLLNEKVREDIRYRKGKIISLGASIDVLNEGEIVLYDRMSGALVEDGHDEYRVITVRDVVAVV